MGSHFHDKVTKGLGLLSCWTSFTHFLKASDHYELPYEEAHVAMNQERPLPKHQQGTEALARHPVKN